MQAVSVIKRRSPWHTLSPQELWDYKDLTVALVEKDLKLRYRQTALGVLWILLQPLMGAAIFSVVFHKVAGIPAPAGVPYFVLSYSGLLCWNAFNTSVTRASAAVLQNAQLISKVYFPRLVLPFSAGAGAAIDFFIGYAMLLIMLVMNGIPLTPLVFAAPIWCFVSIALGLGVGLFASALMVSYRDVQYLLPVALQFLMYASPVAYTLKQAVLNVPKPIAVMYKINPLAGLIEVFRNTVTGQPADMGLALYAVAATIIAFIAGAIFFARMERNFADVI